MTARRHQSTSTPSSTRTFLLLTSYPYIAIRSVVRKVHLDSERLAANHFGCEPATQPAMKPTCERPPKPMAQSPEMVYGNSSFCVVVRYVTDESTPVFLLCFLPLQRSPLSITRVPTCVRFGKQRGLNFARLGAWPSAQLLSFLGLLPSIANRFLPSHDNK